MHTAFKWIKLTEFITSLHWICITNINANGVPVVRTRLQCVGGIVNDNQVKFAHAVYLWAWKWVSARTFAPTTTLGARPYDHRRRTRPILQRVGSSHPIYSLKFTVVLSIVRPYFLRRKTHLWTLQIFLAFLFFICNCNDAGKKRVRLNG
jgi:hypothetical protein